MRPLSTVFAFLLTAAPALAALTSLAGCARDPAPPLLDVTELVPHEVERGERLEIRGRGFGEGRQAHLTFHGVLHRPGEEPELATLETSATAIDEETIELAISERVEALFCKDGDRLAHTTFTGELEVAFAPAMASAPPVSATLHGVRLDLAPPIRERIRDESFALEGTKVLADLGLSLAEQPLAAGGFAVVAVTAASPADKAAIHPGDVLETVDEVSLDSLADARPGGGSDLTLGVRAAGTTAVRTVVLPLGALASAAPRAVTTTALILGIAALVLLLFLAPRLALVDWLELRLAEKMHRGRTREGSSLFASVDFLGAEGRPGLVALGTCAVLALPFADAVGLDLDVGLLFVLAVTGFLVASVLVDLDRLDAGPGRSWRARLRSVLETAVEQIPAALALACVVLLTGSLRLREIIGQQGGSPWDWSAFRTPVAVLLVVAWFSAARSTAPADMGLPEAETERRHMLRGPTARRLPPVSEAHLFVLALLGAAVFFGGWTVPGAASANDAGLMLRAVGAVIFGVKTWTLYVGVRLVQTLLPRLSFAQRFGIAFGALVPWALLAFAGSAAWAFTAPSHAVERAVGALSFASAALAVVASGWRILRAASRGVAAPHLDPFS